MSRHENEVVITKDHGMLTTAVRFGPKSHGRVVTDEELQHAEFRPGYDYEVIFGRFPIRSTKPRYSRD